MPSEKSRYLNRGPSSPLDRKQLKAYLKHFSHDRLVDIVWLHSESNNILWQALSSSIAIQEAHGDWGKIKQAINYAFYFTDHIPYSDHEYGIIIDQLINALDFLSQNLGEQFALQVAHYMYEEGKKVLECFDDDWDWICALETLELWIKNSSKIKIDEEI